MKTTKKGFSLLEIMIVVAILGGISLGVMQMLKGMQKGQVDVQNFTDYTGIAQESNFLLNDLNSCKVSLQGTTFHGSTIKATPITGIQLWSADQAGVRSQKKFYAGASFGKVTIDSVNFSMPDYTATSDWVAGTNQSFTGVVTISSKKKSLGHETTDKLITKSINVTFDTDATGTSTIKSCSVSNTNGKLTMWDSSNSTYTYPNCPSGQSFVGGIQWANGAIWRGFWTDAEPKISTATLTTLHCAGPNGTCGWVTTTGLQYTWWCN